MPLSPSGRLVRILCSVIQALVPPVLDRGHHLSLGGAVAGQLVRDHDTRGPALLFQQLAEQALGGLLVPPALDENVEPEAILVDGPPEPVLLSPDQQAHLVEVPLVCGRERLRRLPPTSSPRILVPWTAIATATKARVVPITPQSRAITLVWFRIAVSSMGLHGPWTKRMGESGQIRVKSLSK